MWWRTCTLTNISTAEILLLEIICINMYLYKRLIEILYSLSCVPILYTIQCMSHETNPCIWVMYIVDDLLSDMRFIRSNRSLFTNQWKVASSFSKLTCLPRILILEIAFRFTSCLCPVEGALFPRCIDPDAFEALAPHLHLSPQEWAQVQTERPDKTWTVANFVFRDAPGIFRKKNHIFDSSEGSLYMFCVQTLALFSTLKRDGTSKITYSIPPKVLYICFVSRHWPCSPH